VRWVIVGPFPPERGDGPEATVGAAAERLRAGESVLTVSPRPSAAHRHQGLVGRSAWRPFGRLIEPGDSLWVRLEPGVLFTRAPGRVESLIERAWFRWAVRRCGRVVVDVGDVALLPGGRAGALTFAAIDELVVHTEADRQTLLAAGATASRLVGPDHEVEPVEPVEDLGREPAAPPLGPVVLPPGADRAAIERLVRERAAAAPVRPGRRS
jgi:hypothetical protein